MKEQKNKKWRFSPRGGKVTDKDAFLWYHSEFYGKNLREKLDKAMGKNTNGISYDPNFNIKRDEVAKIGEEIVKTLKDRENEFIKITCPRKEYTLTKCEALQFASKILDVIATHEAYITHQEKYIDGTKVDFIEKLIRKHK